MNLNINLIRSVEWEEVFITWFQNEGQKENYLTLAKERGHASWADWRINGFARRFECEKADWGFYEITNPSEVVSSWYGGPFRTWIEEYYNGADTRSFAELASNSKILENSGVQSMVNDYPASSIIAALELSDGRIVVIEGSHRACALAIMKVRGLDGPEKLTFAIGKSKLSELPVVGKNTLRK